MGSSKAAFSDEQTAPNNKAGKWRIAAEYGKPTGKGRPSAGALASAAAAAHYTCTGSQAPAPLHHTCHPPCCRHNGHRNWSRFLCSCGRWRAGPASGGELVGGRRHTTHPTISYAPANRCLSRWMPAHCAAQVAWLGWVAGPTLLVMFLVVSVSGQREGR